MQDTASPPSQPVVAPPRTFDWAGLVILLAGGLAILGSFLPWIQSTSLSGSFGPTGLDLGRDGVISIVLGIIMALFAIAILARSGRRNVARVGALICAVALGWFACIDIVHFNSGIAFLYTSIDGSLYFIGSLGPGPIVVALAAALGVVGVFLPGGPEAVAGPSAQQAPPG